MLNDTFAHDAGATLRWVELAERLRASEVALLHCLGLVRGIDPDVHAASAVVLSQADVDELREAVEELNERVELVRALAEQTPRRDFEIRARTLQLEAEAALSAGVVDVERVQVLARCLPVHSGFPALAATLRCTDAHEAWDQVTVGDLLGCFADADPPLVRDITSLAMLSPEARWDQCDREQLRRLAAVLEHEATKPRHRHLRGR